MTPVEQALEEYGQSLYELLDHYLQNGYIYSGPDAFAMVMLHSRATLLGVQMDKELDKCDCWFVQYVSGDLVRLMALLNELPHKMKWIVFNRNDGPYRVYDLEKFNEKIKST